jgi:hypothetical protein
MVQSLTLSHYTSLQLKWCKDLHFLTIQVYSSNGAKTYTFSLYKFTAQMVQRLTLSHYTSLQLTQAYSSNGAKPYTFSLYKFTAQMVQSLTLVYSSNGTKPYTFSLYKFTAHTGLQPKWFTELHFLKIQLLYEAQMVLRLELSHFTSMQLKWNTDLHFLTMPSSLLTFLVQTSNK